MAKKKSPLSYVENSAASKVGQIEKRIKEKIRYLFLGAALLTHEPLVHPGLVELTDSHLVQPYRAFRQKQREEEAARNMPAAYLAIYEEDKKFVAEMNEPRKRRIEARKKAAAEFKADVKNRYPDLPIAEIYFPIEYYFQGISDEDQELGREVFKVKLDNTQVDAENPTRQDLQNLLRIFVPPNSYDSRHSSAIYSLSTGLRGKTQNCQARARLLAMVLASKYPGLRKKILFQYFKKHVRVLLEVGDTRYIMESDVGIFPDEETLNMPNYVIPVEDEIGSWAGVDKTQVSRRIERFGNRGKGSHPDYLIVTDDMVGSAVGGDLELGNHISMEQYYEQRKNTGAGDKETGDKETGDKETASISESCYDGCIDDNFDFDNAEDFFAKRVNPYRIYYYVLTLKKPTAPKVRKVIQALNAIYFKKKLAIFCRLNVRLEGFSSEMARELGEFQGGVKFLDLEVLPSSWAKALQGNITQFDFPSLEYLSPEAAMNLLGLPATSNNMPPEIDIDISGDLIDPGAKGEKDNNSERRVRTYSFHRLRGISSETAYAMGAASNVHRHEYFFTDLGGQHRHFLVSSCGGGISILTIRQIHPRRPSALLQMVPVALCIFAIGTNLRSTPTFWRH